MNNRVKIFMESASQMGVGKPELEALTKLFKVCLESALEDEDNIDLYEDDLDEDGEDASSLTDHTKSSWDEEDEMDELNPDEETLNTPVESTVGTKLANAYIQYAPKLLARKMCTPANVGSLHAFITWLLTKFKDYDYKSYLNNAVDSPSYDTERMDDMLYLVDMGSPVVQLLTDINNTFGDTLKQATLTNETSIFTAARAINDFISETFSQPDVKNEPADPNIIVAEKFYDVGSDIDAGDPNEKKEKLGADKAETTSSPDKFDADADMDIIDKAVDAFIKFTPTIGMSDREAANFNKPIDKETKKKLKTAATKRGEVSKMYNGDVVDANAWKKADEDDLWADL